MQGTQESLGGSGNMAALAAAACTARCCAQAWPRVPVARIRQSDGSMQGTYCAGLGWGHPTCC